MIEGTRTGRVRLAPYFGELAALPLFCVYQLRPKADGRPGTDKVPVGPYTQPHPWLGVDAHDVTSRMDLAEAEIWLADLDSRPLPGGVLGHGIGFVLTAETNAFFLDLDHCLEAGAWASYVEPVLNAFPGAYVEVSASGDGIHVLGRYVGPRPLHGTRCKEMRAELYTAGRFCALTGTTARGLLNTDHSASLAWLLQWFPQRGESGHGDEWTETAREGYGIADDAQLVDRAKRSTSLRAAFGGGISFAQLWDADQDALARAFPPQTAGQNHDGSAADLAMCNHLSFWTGGNCEQMARLLRASGLAREKHGREDYVRSTVLRACAGQTQWYSDRTRTEPLAGVGLAPAGAIASDAKPESAHTPTAAPAGSPAIVHTVTFDRQGRIEASLANLAHLIREGNAGQVRYDTFTDQIIVNAEPLTDDLITRIRIAFESARIAPPSKENTRDAIERIARENAYDSAQDWLTAQTWDGVPRIATFLPVYCGTEDNEYSRACSMYLLTAMAGRVMAPGCQADMVPVLVGPQGLRKSSAIAALAPHPDYFTEIQLGEKEADLARKMRGKVIGEIAELQGLKTRDAQTIRAFITTKYDKWVPKFKEFSASAARRLVFVGSANEDRFLDDETGERRWLPNRCVRMCDSAAVERDRGQLWAEAREYWLLNGIAWQAAEYLARVEHGSYKVADPWEQSIAAWVSVAGRERFTTAELLTGALSIAARDMSRTEQSRAAKVLRQLGYSNQRMTLAGERVWRWARAPL